MLYFINLVFASFIDQESAVFRIVRALVCNVECSLNSISEQKEP